MKDTTSGGEGTGEGSRRGERGKGRGKASVISINHVRKTQDFNQS